MKQRIASLTSIQASNKRLILNNAILDDDSIIDEKLYSELQQAPFITFLDQTSAIGKGQLSQKDGVENEIEFEIKQINNPDPQKYDYTIYIKYRNQSKPLPVGFNKGETVNDLKQRIASQTNLPAKNQELVLNATSLDDDYQVIDSTQLLNAPFIHLLYKKTG